MKTIRTLDSLRREVSSLVAEHIVARLKTHPDGVVTLRAGVDVIQQARASVGRWQKNACEVFLLLVESTEFLTKREIGAHLGLTEKVVHDIWSRTIGGTSVNVYTSANGEPVEMMLFRYKKERAFSPGGKNANDEPVKAGIRLVLYTKGLGFREGQNVFATTKNVTRTFTENLENAANAIANGTKRETTEWDRQRAEIEAVKRRGEQVAMPLTGTAAE